MEPVAVLAVDDQQIFLGVARDVVGATPGFCWAGEAGSGEEAIVAVAELQPDLVLLDVRMPGMGGIEAARRISAAYPDVVVVLISVDDQSDVAVAAEESGAAALIGKQTFGPATLRALWARHGVATG